MRDLMCIIVVLYLQSANAFSLNQAERIFKRYDGGTNEVEIAENIKCIDVKNTPEEFWLGWTGIDDSCSLWLLCRPEQLVEITVEDFDVSCENEGGVQLLDGWIVENQVFPSDVDHPSTPGKRLQTFCGSKRPLSVFVSSQNVAQIIYKVPRPGQKFKISVNFLDNPQPCNVVSMQESGVLTLRNYGRRVNCSVSIVYPERVNVVDVNVGVSGTGFPVQAKGTGITKLCRKKNMADYVELLMGNGLDTSAMKSRMDFCGLYANDGKGLTFQLGCQHSVVRLVSSGLYYNSITFRYRPLTEAELPRNTNLACS